MNGHSAACRQAGRRLGRGACASTTTRRQSLHPRKRLHLQASRSQSPHGDIATQGAPWPSCVSAVRSGPAVASAGEQVLHQPIRSVAPRGCHDRRRWPEEQQLIVAESDLLRIDIDVEVRPAQRAASDHDRPERRQRDGYRGHVRRLTNALCRRRWSRHSSFAHHGEHVQGNNAVDNKETRP